MDFEIYDRLDGKQLFVDNDEIKAEFKVATRKAMERMDTDFEFYGYTVEVDDAIDVINEIESERTYH